MGNELFPMDMEKGNEAFLYVAMQAYSMASLLGIFYVADRLSLAQYGRPIYGEQYAAWRCGPIPRNAAQRLAAYAQNAGIQLSPGQMPSPDLSFLSESDIECLDEARRICESAERIFWIHDEAWKKAWAKGWGTPITTDDMIMTLPEGEWLLEYLRG